MLRNSSPLMPPRWREAPITATPRGRKNRSIAATAAIASRCSNRALASGSSEAGKVTRMNPGSLFKSVGKPSSRRTASIGAFSGATCVSSSAIPAAMAAWVSCPSRIVPSPLLWNASATRTTGSALPGRVMV